MARTVGLTFAKGCCLRRFNVTRPDAVALNVEFSVFGADVFGQHFQTAFGCCIRRNGFTTEFAHHGANVDDFAVPFLNHAWDYCFGNDKRTVQVNINHLAKICSTHFVHRDAFDDAGIVHQDIYYAYFFFNFRNHFVDSGFVSHIAYVPVGFDSGFLIGLKTFIYKFGLDVVKHDCCACFGQCRSDGEADSVRCAGNQCYFPFQIKWIHNEFVCSL